MRIDTERMRPRVLQVLRDVGMEVQNETLKSAMLARGCTETADGYIAIPEELVEEFVARQKKTQAEDADDRKLHPFCGIDWTHWIMWTDQKEQIRRRLEDEFLMSAFDCGPTRYYDYRAAEHLPVDTDVFTTMMKLAEATPEIGYISTWYRQDVPEAIERIDSLMLALRHTGKVDGIEAINPDVIKYLVEIGEIMSGRPNDARYLAGSQCIISPLTLEKRSADEMVERHRLGLDEYHIASMPAIGVNFPCTPAAGVIMSAAETLGGMITAYCLDPDSDITGRMICTYMDMRTADTTSANPESILVDLAVRELFDECFGGHLWTEVFFSPSATEPGLMAVHQNYYAAMARAQITGDITVPYPGMGTLDNGAVGSPTQFMLDMQIRKAQWHLSRQSVQVTEETVPFEDMLKRARERDHFLGTEHTMDHFRELYNSDVLPISVGNMDAMNHESGILDECEDRWRANVEDWQPPVVDDDTMKALEDVLKRAKDELL